MAVVTKGVGIGQVVVDFELRSLNGPCYRLSNYRTQPVILFFVREKRSSESVELIKCIQQIYSTLSRYGEILVILTEDFKRKNSTGVRDYAMRHSLPFPILFDKDGQTLDSYNFYKNLGLSGFQLEHPSLFVLNSQHEIAFNYVGPELRGEVIINWLLSFANPGEPGMSYMEF